MATLALYRDFHLHKNPTRSSQPASARGKTKGIFRRIVAAIARSHQRQVERDAGRFIATHGGRLTDDIERQLADRLGARRGFGS